jgi:hypothetical protein
MCAGQFYAGGLLQPDHPSGSAAPSSTTAEVQVADTTFSNALGQRDDVAGRVPHTSSKLSGRKSDVLRYQRSGMVGSGKLRRQSGDLGEMKSGTLASRQAVRVRRRLSRRHICGVDRKPRTPVVRRRYLQIAARSGYAALGLRPRRGERAETRLEGPTTFFDWVITWSQVRPTARQHLLRATWRERFARADVWPLRSRRCGRPIYPRATQHEHDPCGPALGTSGEPRSG